MKSISTLSNKSKKSNALDKKLPEKEIIKLCNNISSKTFKFLQSRTISELTKVHNYKEISLNDYFNIVNSVLSNICLNELMHVKDFYKQRTQKEIDMPKFIYSFIMNLTLSINEEDCKILMEMLRGYK